MPKVRGLLDYFPKLSAVEFIRVKSWFEKLENSKLSENDLGNHLLYSFCVPVSAKDLSLDLSLLREGLRLHEVDFYDKHANKIYLPEGLLQKIPNLPKIVWAFLDIYTLSELTTVVLKGETLGVKNLGTVIKPEVLEEGSVSLSINSKKYEAKIGTLMVLPAKGSHVDLEFTSSSARLFKKNNLVCEVAGGLLGVVLDLR